MLPSREHVVHAVDHAFVIGMHQHRDEIVPCAEWLNGLDLHHVVEIGSLRGGTASLWGKLATGKVISVDLPNGAFGGAAHGLDHAAMVARNVMLFKENNRFAGVLGDSHSGSTLGQVKTLLPDGEGVDLLFIDGDHTLEGVTQDWEMYSPLVNPGGVILFHDINDTPFHHDAGCFVDQLWNSLHRESMLIPGTDWRIFSIDANWGGIGALVTK